VKKLAIALAAAEVVMLVPATVFPDKRGRRDLR
jgi:hypothetical protein